MSNMTLYTIKKKFFKEQAVEFRFVRFVAPMLIVFNMWLYHLLDVHYLSVMFN